MSAGSEPIPRKFQRKGNRLRKKINSLPGTEQAEEYLETLRNFEYTVEEPVEYDEQTYTVKERLTFSYNKKYVISDGTSSMKVPENEIL